MFEIFDVSMFMNLVLGIGCVLLSQEYFKARQIRLALQLEISKLYKQIEGESKTEEGSDS